MKFSAVVLATAAATGATADTVLNVSGFYAGCGPHDPICGYSFEVIQPGTTDTDGDQCKTIAPNSGFGEIPEIKRGPCYPSGGRFDLIRSDEGLTLTVSIDIEPDGLTKGSYLIPNADFKTVKGDNPTGNSQFYIGPGDFSLERVN